MSINHRFQRFLLVGIIITLMIVGMVNNQAGATASPLINTNDNNVDLNWGSAFYTSGFNDDTIDDTDEVYKAWVQSTSTALYFRLQTYFGPAISNGNSAVAALDCDQNDNFDENEPDRRIIYDPAVDEVYLYDGTNAYKGTVCSPCTTGERPTTGEENIEWQFVWDSVNPPLEAFPADCRNQVDIKIATANNSSKTAISTSSTIGWDIPAVVDLQHLQASSYSGDALVLFGLISLAAVGGLAILTSWRRKKL